MFALEEKIAKLEEGASEINQENNQKSQERTDGDKNVTAVENNDDVSNGDD